jgi:hypothetical protein
MTSNFFDPPDDVLDAANDQLASLDDQLEWQRYILRYHLANIL